MHSAVLRSKRGKRRRLCYRDATADEGRQGAKGRDLKDCVSPAAVLRDVALAVVVEPGVAPRMALAVLLNGPHGPVRIVILLLKLGQFRDDLDAGHCRILRSNRQV